MKRLAAIRPPSQKVFAHAGQSAYFPHVVRKEHGDLSDDMIEHTCAVRFELPLQLCVASRCVVLCYGLSMVALYGRNTRLEARRCACAALGMLCV